jgi:hypothetical protein
VVWFVLRSGTGGALMPYYARNEPTDLDYDNPLVRKRLTLTGVVLIGLFTLFGALMTLPYLGH